MPSGWFRVVVVKDGKEESHEYDNWDAASDAYDKAHPEPPEQVDDIQLWTREA